MSTGYETSICTQNSQQMKCYGYDVTQTILLPHTSFPLHIGLIKRLKPFTVGNTLIAEDDKFQV